MSFVKLADDVYQLSGFPSYAINAYVIEGVLIDARTRWARGSLLKQLRGLDISAHTLTHAHPDHQGSTHWVCEALGIPLWCGEADADAAERSELIRARMPEHWLNPLVDALFTGPGHPVERRLREGDRVGSGFVVLETPGHTAGHLSFWRESDRVLILGDVLNNQNVFTGWPGLREPPRPFTLDPALNRSSARRLAELRPEVVGCGHGRILRSPERFVGFINGLPE